MDSKLASVKEQFSKVFGADGRTHVIRAPGRVNLIGEHTDYNDGFVFPMAIEPQVLLVCRARDDAVVRFASTAFPNETAQWSLQQEIKTGEPKWANYMKGVSAELIDAGIPLSGMDALMTNSLPVGSGLSSSAAIMVSTAQAFLTIAGLSMEPDRIALITQRAEHEFAGTPSGIMDMTIVAAGKANHAMLLDCRDRTRQYIAIDPVELRIVIVNTMVRHELSGGEYAERRRQCEQATEFFQKNDPGIRALRDVRTKQIESAKGKLPDLVWRRARHVVTEIARTTAAAALLARRHYEDVGELMRQSHASLRDDYEVSTPELDFLVDIANQTHGVYGARMTGGGFGGCIVSLVQALAVDDAVPGITDAYQKKFDIVPEVFVTNATNGVSVLE